MSKIFTRNFRTRWSELDANGDLAPAGYLRFLVETAYDWGAALGLGAKNDRTLGLFWLIRETELNILRPLRHDDEFNFTIWMVNWQKVRGTRCFELTNPQTGEVLAQGSQHIVSMSAETNRPASPPEDILQNFRLEAPRVFPFQRFPKIAPDPNAFNLLRQVEWGDLDPLEHVNNATYVTYAEELTARERATRNLAPATLAERGLKIFTRRIHIQYLSPALWGETLRLATQPLQETASEGRRYINITRAADSSPVCECLLDWQALDRRTGEPVAALQP